MTDPQIIKYLRSNNPNFIKLGISLASIKIPLIKELVDTWEEDYKTALISLIRTKWYSKHSLDIGPFITDHEGTMHFIILLKRIERNMVVYYLPIIL